MLIIEVSSFQGLKMYYVYYSDLHACGSSGVRVHFRSRVSTMQRSGLEGFH